MSSDKSPAPRRQGTPVESVFGGLQKEMNRLFSDFFTDLETRPLGQWVGGRLVPSMDIAETDKAFEVTAELPGMDDKDVEVSVVDGMLTIRGEKKDETEDKQKNYHRIERSYGSFQRTLSIPANVDEEGISADFKKGVLTVTMPKTTETAGKGPKKIQIKGS